MLSPLLLGLCQPFEADLHLPLLEPALSTAAAANRELAIDNAIDFETKDTPHVTL